MSRISFAVMIAALVALSLQSGLVVADSYEDASKLFKQGNLAAALEKVEAAIAAKPRDARARFLKGLILTEQAKPLEAIKVFTALTEDYPELPEPYNNLAVLYASQGQYDKARKSLEMAIRTHPSYAIAHENLGDVYAKMASEAYDKALQLDRGNAAAQTKLAMIKDLFSSSVVPGKASSQPDGTGNAPSGTASAAQPDKPDAAARPGPSPGKADTDAVLATVQNWAKAWSDKDVDAYLAFYAPNFQVPGGETRTAWETMRRDRITKPKSIEVTVLAPRVSFDSTGRALMKFRQGYRSDTINSSGAKTLTLVRNNDRWQIVQEKMN